MKTCKRILLTASTFTLFVLTIFVSAKDEYAFAANVQWSSPEKIGVGYYPSLTVLNGKIWVAYTTTKQSPDVANEVQVISSNDNGTTWSAPEVIFEAKTQWVAWAAHHTTFVSSDDELWLAWNVNKNPGGETSPALYFAKSDDNGLNWNPTKIPYEGNMPRIADMQNKIWLFYDTMQGIAYTTTSDGGTSWSEPFTVPATSSQSYPMACQVNGEIWVVYSKVNTDWELDLIRSTNGISWSSSQKISNATPEQRIALIENYKGRAFAFYPRSVGQSWSVYVTTSSDGITWSSPERVADECDYPLMGGFGQTAIVNNKLWFVYTSNGEILYTALGESGDITPDDDIIQQPWWLWTNAILATTTVFFAVTTIYYRKKASEPKETKTSSSQPAPKGYSVCPNCGAQLPTDSKFCGKCGTSLQ